MRSTQNERNVQVRGRGRPRPVRTGSRGRPRRQFHLVDPAIEPNETNSANEYEEIGHLAEIPIESAIQGPDAHEWHEAIASDLGSILSNDTWQLIDRPKGETVIGSRIVLRNKYGKDGTLERRKARIVARGFVQRPGMDFDDTFAPVTRIESIRILVSKIQ